MRPTLNSLAGLAATLIIAGSASLQLGLSAAHGADPATPYLGMSKSEIIACAGEPYARYQSGARAETLTFHYSGAGPVPAPPGEKKKDKPSFFGIDKKKGDKNKGDKGWTCSASLVFENDRLVRVSFAHKDVRSPYEWQSEKNPKKAEKMRKAEVPTCTFSLPRCAGQ
jgi:hypothetical protein